MSCTNGTILFVMPRLPFPAVSGRKTSLYHYCRILSEELGYRLVVAAFLEKGDKPEEKPDFISRLVVLPKAKASKKIGYIFKDSLIKKKKPMQVSLYWNPEAQKIVKQLAEEEKPDIVIGDMVRSIEYIKDLKAFRISDLDDRISLRYQRQMDSDMDGINPYGAFLDTLPKLLRKMLSVKFVKRSVVKNEIKLLRNFELEMGRICERTVFVAQKEAEQFNEELGERKAMAVPIGVDTEFFRYEPKNSKENYIGFLGAMNVAHNENAVRHFIDDIFPSVIKQIPDAKFLVIGGGASDELQKLSNDHIIFSGRVKDVREYLDQCKVFVCPMTFGSGIKTKNLEAMSMGLPLVTTSVGAENINARDMQDWIVADDEQGFANAVIDLLSDENKRQIIGKNANEFIKKNFTWQVAKEKFQAIFEELE